MSARFSGSLETEESTVYLAASIMPPQTMKDCTQLISSLTPQLPSVIMVSLQRSLMPINFKEHELDAFLHDNRKVIEISAKISVQTATGRVGTLVMGERGEL